MAVEQTLSIIKPDGVQKNLIGEIYSRFEKAGLEIVAARMMHLTTAQAQGRVECPLGLFVIGGGCKAMASPFRFARHEERSLAVLAQNIRYTGSGSIFPHIHLDRGGA